MHRRLDHIQLPNQRSEHSADRRPSRNKHRRPGPSTQRLPVDAAPPAGTRALRRDARLWFRAVTLLPKGRYSGGCIRRRPRNGGDFYSQSLGTFLFAVDLGSFPAEDDNAINIGLSTLTSTRMLLLEFNDEPTTQSYRLSSFACYDSLYFIDDNGILNGRK